MTYDPNVIKNQVTPQPDVASAFTDAKHQAQAEQIELNARAQFLSLRETWSNWLIFWICVLILFQIVVTFLIGTKTLNFTDYQWFLPLVITENFLQIVGMGVIIVKFLYPAKN